MHTLPCLDNETGGLASAPMGRLPSPVERFYQEIYGRQVPTITSATVTGSATLRLGGVPLPARFRFVHEAGHSYSHFLEVAPFGLPLLKVHEEYQDGRCRMSLPWGTIAGETKVDQAANLALWAEAIWFPAIWITDERVRWHPVDENTALLSVPGVQNSLREHFVVRFDPTTGMPFLLEAMRYKGLSSNSKTLWLAEARSWGVVDGYTIPRICSLTWLDDGKPWSVFLVESVVYKGDVLDELSER